MPTWYQLPCWDLAGVMGLKYLLFYGKKVPKIVCILFAIKQSTKINSSSSQFYIRKYSIIYVTILSGVVLVCNAPTAFHNVVVDDSA
jgi:hypothetical protein